MSLGKRSQNQHLVRLNTVLGDDALFVDHLSAKLGMSTLGNFSLHVYSDTHHAIQPKELIGTPATICIMDEAGLPIYYNSYITQFYNTAPSGTGEATKYMVELQPWLKFLEHDSDCRIFQNMSVIEVINKIFERYGSVANYKIIASGSYQPKRYQVQYNETNLNFFHRICEDAGLAYFFTFENGLHTLNITDLNTPPAALEPKVIEYQPHTKAKDHLNSWSRVGRFSTGNFEHRSYNYKSPQSPLVGNNTAKGELAETPRVMETYHYRFIEDLNSGSELTKSAATRIAQLSEKAIVVNGSGDCRYLKIGHFFSAVPVPATSFFPDKDKEFTLVDISINANNEGYYEASFTAIPKGELAYPDAHEVTIPGLQTAVVTGPKGEEIYMDPEGRVKVQFHWDRLGKLDENTTCWLRVMQSFAGPSFGAHFTPRIGQEVVVAFENGNPDRPFVMGALYHPENPPPYASNKGTRAGIRTRSSKGGKVTNCNELYFEDKKGSEEVFFQAEKDHNVLVKNIQQIKIGKDKAQQVVNNETHKVGKNFTIEVGDKLLIDAGKEIKLQVGGSTITITSSKIDISSSVVDINGMIKLN